MEGGLDSPTEQVISPNLKRRRNQFRLLYISCPTTKCIIKSRKKESYDCAQSDFFVTNYEVWKFPLKNQVLLSKWVSAIRRDKFVPTHFHRICSEHFTECSFWKSSSKRLLKDDAVPTIFSFPSHVQKIEEPDQNISIDEAWPGKVDVNSANETYKNHPSMNTTEEYKVDVDSTTETYKSHPPMNTAEGYKADVNSSSETYKSYPPMNITEEHNYTLSHRETLQKIRNEIKRKDVIINSLRSDIIKYKQKCSKQDCTRRKLKSALSDLKEKTLMNEHALRVLNNNLSNIMIDIVSTSDEQNAEYSDALKKFAKSVYFKSPAAYEYIRHSLCKALPQANMVRKWILNGSSSMTEEYVAASENQA